MGRLNYDSVMNNMLRQVKDVFFIIGTEEWFDDAKSYADLQHAIVRKLPVILAIKKGVSYDKELFREVENFTVETWETEDELKVIVSEVVKNGFKRNPLKKGEWKNLIRTGVGHAILEKEIPDCIYELSKQLCVLVVMSSSPKEFLELVIDGQRELLEEILEEHDKIDSISRRRRANGRREANRRGDGAGGASQVH